MVQTTAVVFAAPGQIALEQLSLIPNQRTTEPEALVEVLYSGISTGTERMLWSGDMPAFPGMGYPLVPGYETVGRVIEAPRHANVSEGDLVYVPGANCYGPVRGLFGGAAKAISIAPAKLSKIDESLGEQGTLLALAATAQHAISVGGTPDLIIGHGTLGRLIARLAMARGSRPTVWETDATRHDGSTGYNVVTPDDDQHKDYQRIIDASGDHRVLDRCMTHLARRGEITLAGFYAQPLSFVFPPAFMREASIRIAAQWQAEDLADVVALQKQGAVSFDGLITHRSAASAATEAYNTAFQNRNCLKMVLDWRDVK